MPLCEHIVFGVSISHFGHLPCPSQEELEEDARCFLDMLEYQRRHPKHPGEEGYEFWKQCQEIKMSELQTRRFVMDDWSFAVNIEIREGGEKMSNHDTLCKKAEAALDAVFSDTDVSPGTTKSSLEDLIGYIRVMLDAPADDAKASTGDW